jgi:NAD+ kinase
MRVGILSRLDMPEAIKLADKLYHLLSKEYDVSLDESLLSHINGKRISDCDVLVTVGGDGTILYAVRKYDMPIVGINMGRHGFLCEVPPQEISILPGIFENHIVEERTKLEIVGMGEALNEVVVRGKTPTKTSHLLLDWGGRAEFFGDGLIISTPTGSTAYSLSAGGPIVSYNSPVFVVTPLCPTDRRFVPTVVSDDVKIRVTVKKEKCYLAYDGILKRELDPNEGFEARKSTRHAIFWRRK